MSDSKVDPLDPGEPPEVKPDAAPAPELAAAPETSPQTPATPKKKRRTWKRRIWLTILVLLILALLVRVAVQVAFPVVLNKVLANYDLSADYSQLRLSMFSGDLGIGRIEFKSLKTGELFASANYVRATISPLKLLIGKLEVWRVEADGVDVNLTREADGSIGVLGDLLSNPKSIERRTEAVRNVTTSSEIDLTSPVYVEGFRLQHLRVSLTDKSLSPPLKSMIKLDVRVDDIGSIQRPTQFYVSLYSDPVLDSLTVEGQGRIAGASVEADVRIGLKGLHLKPVAQYLEPLGIRPVAYDLSATAYGTVRASPATLVSAVTELAAATQPGTRSATGPAAPGTQPADVPFPINPKPAEYVGGTLKLKNLALMADGKEAAACDAVEIDLAGAKFGVMHLSRILVDGVRAKASRNAQGNIVAAGIELIPVATPTTRPATSASPAAPAKPLPVTELFPATARVSLDELLVKNVRMSFDDHFVPSSEMMSFDVDWFSIKDFVLDPDKPDARIRIAGAFKSPGVVRAIKLNGTAAPFAQTQTLNLVLDVSGIEPTILKPYLDFAGLDSTLKDASFKASLSAEATVDPAGKIGAKAHLGGISFRDGNELFGMKDVKFAGVTVDPATGVLRVNEIEISGPTLAFKREKDGAFSGFGFRTKTRTPYEPPKRPESEPSAIKLAKFELGKFTWKDVTVRFDDLASDPPASVAIGDAGLEITDFSFDLEDLEPPTQPGRIKGWLVAPNVAEKLSMEGSLTSTTSTLKADLLFSGQGITAAGLTGYLKTVGIEPLLKDGSFLAHVKTTIGKTDKGLKASVAIEDVVYSDGQTELAGIDRVKLDSIEFSPTTLSLGVVEIARPRASVTLEKGNALNVGGIRFRAPEVAAKPAPAPVLVPAATQPTTTVAEASAPLASNARVGAAPVVEPFAMVLGGLKLTDATLQLSDQSAAKPMHTTARVNLTMGALTLGRDGTPADLDVALKVDDIVDAVSVKGNLLANPKAQAAVLKIDLSGLRGTALAGYLPAGMALSLKDGRLTTEIDAGIEQLPTGGMKVRLSVNGLDYRDGQGGPTLMKLDQFRIVAPEINPGGDVITIDQVELSGFELDAVRATDGSIGVMGLSMGVPVPAGAAVSVAGEPVAVTPRRSGEAPGVAPATQPSVAATQPASAPTDVAAAVAKVRKSPPLVTVNTLDLNVRRIGYLDQSVEGAKPLTVADLRFRLLEKLVMLGKDPAGQPPAKFQLTGKVDPLIGSINVGITTSPFAQQPTVNADVILGGINGDGIFAVAPKLRELIDTADLKDGEFKTKLEATAKVDRRGPMDVDYSKGFDIEALVRNTEFRATRGGDILLGLEEIRVEDAKIRPVKDDAGKQIATSVRIKSIDLTKPMGQVVRDKEGIRVAGLLVKMPTTPATQPVTGPAPAAQPVATTAPPGSEAPGVEPATRPATAPAVAAVKPAGEIRVDKFTVSGIDFKVTDGSVDPPFVLPLTALDVDVRNISNMALYEAQGKPIHISASLNAGKVSVPKKTKGGGVLGAVGGVANLIGGAAQQQPTAAPAIEYEDRELFSQITAGGKLVLYPKPDGYMKVNVSSFEIPAVTGYAKQKDITLSYGTFDLPLDLRGDGNGGFEVDTRPVVTDLSLTDPNSFFAKYLGLPIPTDAAIATVEAADKSITIPVQGVTVKANEATGKFDIGGIEKQILPAVSSVFLNAIRPDAVGAKVVGGVASIVGLDGLFAGDQKPEAPIVLAFPAGYTGLEPAELAKMRALAERMKKEPELTISVKHDLGGGDLSIAEVRANPATADAEALAFALRQRKIELTAVRAEVAASTRTRLAVGAGPDVNNAVERLRAIDRELSQTEDAMDRMYDLLRPGADRQASRRTRAAALDLGQERLDAARRVLVESGVTGLVDRVNPAKPAFAPGESAEGGTVTIMLVKVKK